MTPHLYAIGLVVDDLRRSLTFYRRLGIEVADPDEGQVHVEASVPGGMHLLWDTPETIRSFHPDWRPPTDGPRVTLAFRLDDPADVDALYAGLVDVGGDGAVPPWDAPWGQRYAVVHDPDGNSIDLFAPNA